MQKIILQQKGEGEKMKNSTMKTLGISLMAGTAMALLGSSMMNPSAKKTTKKMAKKAMNTFSDVMDSIENMM